MPRRSDRLTKRREANDSERDGFVLGSKCGTVRGDAAAQSETAEKELFNRSGSFLGDVFDNWRVAGTTETAAQSPFGIKSLNSSFRAAKNLEIIPLNAQ